MLFLIQCIDRPNSAALRAETRPQHLEYIVAFGDRVRLAGPTLTEDGQTPTGSVFLVDLEDRAAAERFCAEDPYSKAGLFQSTRIERWRQVLPAEGTQR